MSSRGSNETIVAFMEEGSEEVNQPMPPLNPETTSTTVTEQGPVESDEEINQPMPPPLNQPHQAVHQPQPAIPAGQVDFFLAEQETLRDLFVTAVNDIKTQIGGLTLANEVIASKQEDHDSQMKKLLLDSAEQKELLSKIFAALNDK